MGHDTRYSNFPGKIYLISAEILLIIAILNSNSKYQRNSANFWNNWRILTIIRIIWVDSKSQRKWDYFAMIREEKKMKSTVKSVNLNSKSKFERKWGVLKAFCQKMSLNFINILKTKLSLISVDYKRIIKWIVDKNRCNQWQSVLIICFRVLIRL